MKYMGSKARIAKHILPIMLKDHSGAWYEPFCGGCNILDKVPGERLANDSNEYLIALLRALQRGWLPGKAYSEEEYRQIREHPLEYPPHVVGYVGFNSYGGKLWGGYRRDSTGKRDYWSEHARNLIKQADKLKTVCFMCSDYREYEPKPEVGTIYCDPPYQGSTAYKAEFDHSIFWDWVREKSQRHRVFVSEYNAPDDFKVVWYKQINSSLEKDTGSKKAIEKLFVLR